MKWPIFGNRNNKLLFWESTYIFDKNALELIQASILAYSDTAFFFVLFFNRRRFIQPFPYFFNYWKLKFCSFHMSSISHCKSTHNFHTYRARHESHLISKQDYLNIKFQYSFGRSVAFFIPDVIWRFLSMFYSTL